MTTNNTEGAIPYLLLKNLIDADKAVSYIYDQGIMSGTAFIQAEHDLAMAKQEAQKFFKEITVPESEMPILSTFPQQTQEEKSRQQFEIYNGTLSKLKEELSTKEKEIQDYRNALDKIASGKFWASAVADDVLNKYGNQ